MLDKKLIQLIFLFQFKMGHKAAETTCNINNTFGQGSANECTVQRWFKKFCKGDESLEDEECSHWPPEVDNNREHHQSWSSHNYMRSCWRTQHRPFYSHLAFEANWKDEKAQWVGASWADCKSKNHCFEVSSSLVLCNNNEPFLNWIVTCEAKWILYDNRWWPAQCWSEKLQTWFLCGGLLPVWSTTVSWILAKSWHLRSMLSKLMRGTENCSTCSLHCSTERTQFYSRTLPSHTSHNHASKVEQTGLGSFASSAIVTWPPADQQPLLQASCQLLQGKCFHNQQEVENAFWEFFESWSTNFMLQE